MNLDNVKNKVLTEERLESMLSSKLHIDSSQANSIVKNIDFETYTNLKSALNADDLEKAQSLIGVDETTNSYAAARSGQDNVGAAPEDDSFDVGMLDAGQSIKTPQGDAKIDNVTKLGSETNFSTDKDTNITVSDKPFVPRTPATSPDEIEGEIDRLRKLSGITDQPEPGLGGSESDLTPEPGLGEEAHTLGKPASVTPSTSAAMAGVGNSVNKIKKMHKKAEKPGPKPSIR